MNPAVEATELDFQQLERLLDQIEQTMGAQIVQPLRTLLAGYLTVLQLLESKKITLRKLRRLLLGFSSERTRDVISSDDSADQDGEPNTDSNASSTEAGKTSDSSNADNPGADNPGADNPGADNSASDDDSDDDDSAARGRRRRGHGRNPAAAYIGCETLVVTHQVYRPGDPCPYCGVGTLYRQSQWKQVVRLIGRPPVGGVKYELERLRCGTCGKIETAELPEGVGPRKYDPSVATVIAILRYGLGMPHTRIEWAQLAAGVPLPSATQWEILDAAIGPGIRAVYRQLIIEAAQGELLHNDDTGMQILELTAKLKKGQPLRIDKPDRTGVYTTCILSKAEWRPDIGLFVTGPWHSGENLSGLLQHRLAGLPPPLQMCDALSRNMPGDLQVVVANCLVHARRNFVELSEVFPSQVEEVLEYLKQVYKNDAKAKELGLSAEERLRFHQEHSAPVMDQLHKWLQRQLNERLVEPNSSLGEAINYMLRHWKKLTRFLHVPGAPLDNNVCERALKTAIRHRNNSLFYKTQHGADVGDIYMSLIYTCRLSNANPFDYLPQLQLHAEQAAARPELWLPWNYREQLASE